MAFLQQKSGHLVYVPPGVVTNVDPDYEFMSTAAFAELQRKGSRSSDMARNHVENLYRAQTPLVTSTAMHRSRRPETTHINPHVRTPHLAVYGEPGAYLTNDDMLINVREANDRLNGRSQYVRGRQ